ncbi:SprT-like domain-containing protein [Desulfosarcina sp. OttesenSCG-928-A07]|nr:SprT-like domain-containing protein [Desulfosarcina sp. OttesenSCG-928-G17]MDL2328414.1 SprT-like domain-containing protein [Desulfosarcina sp. OttesenSCG-928-A07]
MPKPSPASKPTGKKGPEREKNSAANPADAAKLLTAFDRKILKGLLAEWENAAWQLPEAIQGRILPPIFGIREMTDRFGIWVSDRREISLSRDLVTHYRWDDVRDVLLHEMAHQVACEALSGKDEPPHGDSFKAVCRMLRISPAATAAYRSLRNRIGDGQILDEQDRIMVKVQKLMALATSANVNEAHAAMQKAYALIARHNISLIEKNTDQSYVSIFVDTPRLRRFREDYHLASLLQEFYFVHGVWVQAWVISKEKMGRVLEISGTSQNVQIAEYVHDTVVRYIHSAWDAYCRKAGDRLGRYRKTDFAVGIIEGFKTTLKSATKHMAADSETYLPVTLTDPGLESYVENRYPHIRRSSRQGPGCDKKILSDGIETGKRLVIAKGISQRADTRTLSLPFKTSSTP